MDGSGVEVIGKLVEAARPPRSKVPPLLVGLEWPPEMKRNILYFIYCDQTMFFLF